VRYKDEIRQIYRGTTQTIEEIQNVENFSPDARNGGWNVLQLIDTSGNTRNNLQRSFVIMKTSAKNGISASM
jgi:hypothetical protein